MKKMLKEIEVTHDTIPSSFDLTRDVLSSDSPPDHAWYASMLLQLGERSVKANGGVDLRSVSELFWSIPADKSSAVVQHILLLAMARVVLLEELASAMRLRAYGLEDKVTDLEQELAALKEKTK